VIKVGVINLDIYGSFPGGVHGQRSFSAMTHGHAHAVTEAIAFLVNKVLPKAIALDHKLHEEGEKPSKGFDPETKGGDSNEP